MIEEIINMAKKAGEIQMKHYKQGFNVSRKNNDMYDLLTDADVESDKFIRRELSSKYRRYKILSEETDSIPQNYSSCVWMVDPLDGTKEFVAKNDEFSVMIGLCENGVPTLGVVYVPVEDELFYAEKGKEARLSKGGKTRVIKVSKLNDLSKAILIDRNPHGEERPLDFVVNNIGAGKIVPLGSTGIKLTQIAEGKAHLHINSNFRLSKWDVCAPQVILEEAGGKVTDLYGKPLNYKQRSLKWKDSVVATNGVLHNKVIKRIQELHF
jgi:3'(2'), 5'-bisphosphate nucleotidase